MSDADTEPPRSITEDHGRTDSPQMTVIGLIVAAGAALVLLPLLPFLAVLWLVADDRDRTTGSVQASDATD
ncbi:MAG: hypothetical protein ABEJ05_08280 [Haloglomus sp.]